MIKQYKNIKHASGYIICMKTAEQLWTGAGSSSEGLLRSHVLRPGNQVWYHPGNPQHLDMWPIHRSSLCILSVFITVLLWFHRPCVTCINHKSYALTGHLVWCLLHSRGALKNGNPSVAVNKDLRCQAVQSLTRVGKKCVKKTPKMQLKHQSALEGL